MPKWEREWRKEEHGMYVSRRKESKERDSDHLVHVFVYGLIIDESEGVVWAA